MKGAFWFSVLGMLLPLAASAGDLLYARSNGAWMAREKPGIYSALNILDADKSTAWCSSDTGQNAEIEIVFASGSGVERMDIATGNQMSPEDFKAFGRVKEILLLEGDESHTVTLEDKTGYQTTHFDPTLSSDRIILKMKGAYRGARHRHVCITDIVFYKGNKPLNGKELGKQIRQHIVAIPFLDTWVSGPEGARERELVFGVSGDYRFVFLPTDADESPVRLTGDWRLQGSDPELKVDKKWVPVKVNRDDAERVISLKIEEGKLAGSYDRRKQANLDY